MSLLDTLPTDLENIIINYKEYYEIVENAKKHRNKFQNIHYDIKKLCRIQFPTDPIMIMNEDRFLSDTTRVQIWDKYKSLDFEICHNCGNYTTIKNRDEIEEIVEKGIYCRSRKIWCNCYD